LKHLNPNQVARPAENPPAATCFYFLTSYFHNSAGEAMIFLQTSTANRNNVSPALMTTKQTCWAAALALPLVIGPVWCLVWQSQTHWLGTLAGLVLLAVLGTCAVTDARRHRIYNWATYSAFLWALVINVAASSMSSGEGALNQAYNRATVIGPETLGGVGLTQSLAGAALCFLITLAGYHLSGRGAGDVKLATVIGALLGVHYGIFAVAYSYVVAAVAIILWSTWANGPLALLKAMLRSIGALLGPLWPFPPTTTDSTLLLRPIPLGPFFAIGTLLVVLELVPS
jgi:Flp pilus assembly protein protease CpaA